MSLVVTRFALRFSKKVLVFWVLLTVALGIAGFDVEKSLQPGGFIAEDAESSVALDQLQRVFNRGGLLMVFAISADQGADSAAARDKGNIIAAGLRTDPRVNNVVSLWDNPQLSRQLRSADGKVGLVVAGVRGGDNEGAKNSHDLAEKIGASSPDVKVQIGGEGIVYDSINVKLKKDLLISELIAVPVTFLVLIWVFGGVVAALIPVAIGVATIVGATGLLRGMASFTDVSVFALNLAIAMGLALAIDYTLLIISRYRHEVASGDGDRRTAILVTMNTAGRTVLFSSLIVGSGLATLILFPMYFMRSFAYASIAVVSLAAVATLVVTPAILVVLGDRIDALSVRRIFRRGSTATTREAKDTRWYRFARAVMRRSVPIGGVLVAVLVLLGAPFLGIRLGYPDDRVLPKAAEPHAVGDLLRERFPESILDQVLIVLPAVDGPPGSLDDYAQSLSRVPGVASVVSPSRSFSAGQPVGPGDASAVRERSAFLTVNSSVSRPEESEQLLRALRGIHAPFPTLFSSHSQHDKDGIDEIIATLPLALSILAITTFFLLFLVTGSIILPLKALLMDVLSLSAVFGSLVWIFQEGHLDGLGTTSTGSLIAVIPVLMFCVAFGLSMDYEVFLLARMKELWDKSDNDAPANDESVALGIAHTGRVVTAAAVLMAIVFAALATSQVSFMRMFGAGMTLAVLLDATIIRMVLVPAFMHVLGRANWWAPRWLTGVHEKIGFRHG